MGAIVAFWLVWWRLDLRLTRFFPMLLATLAVMALALIGQIWPDQIWPLPAAGIAFALSAWAARDLRQFGLKGRQKLEG